MSTPRDDRATAREARRHLQVQPVPLGRADRIRSRSVSPVAPGSFQFPPSTPTPKRSAGEIQEGQFRDALNLTANMATPEQLAAIRDQLRAELRNEVRAELRSEAAATGAGIPDAIKRKPEIPTFDKAHIDHWIRRTENAFIRALITEPQEKFAFLETKFPVDFNPRINDFLWGAATEERWVEFIAYLRTEYGPTKQQRASIFIDGFKRDGKRPSQYAALLNEKTKDVTIEDIKKEMLIREMPTEVQRMLQERIEGLSFEDAAKTADAYFEQDGKLRHTNKASINAVQEPISEAAEQCDDSSNDINAIARRFPNKRPTGPNTTSQRDNRRFSGPNYNYQRDSRQPAQKGWHARTAPKISPTFPRINAQGLCSFHEKYGDNAFSCMAGCSRNHEKRPTGNGKAGPK